VVSFLFILNWTGLDWVAVQVGEDDVDGEDEFAQGCWQEWGDECREEEDDGENGLDVLKSFSSRGWD
jgi:hypothetical protein